MKLEIKSILTVLGTLMLIAAPIPWANAEELSFTPPAPCRADAPQQHPNDDCPHCEDQVFFVLVH